MLKRVAMEETIKVSTAGKKGEKRRKTEPSVMGNKNRKETYESDVNECAQAWLKNHEMKVYENGKPVREYYKCRSVLQKYDWTAVKKIKAMLEIARARVPMLDLYRKAMEYEKYRLATENAKKYDGSREYVIDVKRFMNEGADDVANEIYLP